MRLRISIENDDADARLNVNVDQAVVAFSETQRLATAKALTCAAFRLCPPPTGDDHLGPLRIELATFMNAAVTALLQTAADRRRGSWWQAADEPDAAAEHGLH
jgi:hypothetical protein